MLGEFGCGFDCSSLLSGNCGTGPPRLEKVRCLLCVKRRVSGAHGPAGGSHGHAERFSFGGVWPSCGSGTGDPTGAGGTGIATGGGDLGGSSSSSESVGQFRNLLSLPKYSSSESDSIGSSCALACAEVPSPAS